MKHEGHELKWNPSLVCPDPEAPNRTDIVWKRPDGSVKVIEVSAPTDHNAALMKDRKRAKYANLFAGMTVQESGWVDFVPVVGMTVQESGWVEFVPVVVGATGVVSEGVVRSVERLGVELDLAWLQKIAALETARILNIIL